MAQQQHKPYEWNHHISPIKLLSTDTIDLATSSPSSTTTTPPLTATMGMGRFFANEEAVPELVWKALMLTICVIWSTNFSVVKVILESVPGGHLDPPLYIALRFGLASLILLPLALRSTSSTLFSNPTFWKYGLSLGLCVMVGYIGQSIGLETSSADKSAFLCSLHVIWVALISSLLQGIFHAELWVSLTLAVIGAACIELPTLSLNGGIQSGDLWLFLQPIGFGSGYLVLEKAMKTFPEGATAMTTMKISFVALFALLWSFWNGHDLSDLQPVFHSPHALMGLAYTGIVTTAGAIWMQSWVFKKVPATDASLILTSEPLWASVFSAGLLGEVVTQQEMMGGSLIITGCLWHELRLSRYLERFVTKSSSTTR
eukprot:gene4167-4577_t